MSVFPTEPRAASAGRTTGIASLLAAGVVLGDGGYLIELERRGYVDSGSGREDGGHGARAAASSRPRWRSRTPTRCASCTASSSTPVPQVLQALTFFGTREKLGRAGYGAQTEAINAAAVRLAREVAGDERARGRQRLADAALRARGPGGAGHGPRPDRRADPDPRKDAGVDFLDPRDLLPPAEMRDGARVRGGGRAARRRHHELPAADHELQRRPHPGRVRSGHGRRRRHRRRGELRAGPRAHAAAAPRDARRGRGSARRPAGRVPDDRRVPQLHPPARVSRRPGDDPGVSRRVRGVRRGRAGRGHRLRRRLLRLQRRLHPLARSRAGSLAGRT